MDPGTVNWIEVKHRVVVPGVSPAAGVARIFDETEKYVSMDREDGRRHRGARAATRSSPAHTCLVPVSVPDPVPTSALVGKEAQQALIREKRLRKFAQNAAS